MKKIATAGLLGAILILTGCNEDDSNSAYDCSHVNVSGVVYDVFAEPTLNAIGYFDNDFVVHSECTPSSIVQNGAETTYSYFQHGQAVNNNKEQVHSLNFWLAADGTEMLDAVRVFIPQNGESVTRENGELESIQLMEWTNTMGMVTAQDRFNEGTLQQVRVEYGLMTKERTYNPNTQQWDCTWKESGSIREIDLGCINEAVLDTTYLGVVALGEWYWQDLLSAKRSYQTDEVELRNQIDSYYQYF